MKKFLFVFLLIFFNNYFAQEYVFGKVITEQNTEVPGVLVINIRTEKETYTNKDGNFMIAAESNDLIRFVKQKFDRVSYRLQPEDLKKSITINIIKSPVEIDEVEIKNKLTENLREDSKRLNKNKKTLALNQELNHYMKMKPEKPFPVVLKAPTLFEKPSVNAAQIDIITVIGFVAKLLKKNKTPEFNPSPNIKKGFLMKIRYNLTDNYFLEMGLRLEEIDDFLRYADNKLYLTKNYYKNFNLSKIQFQLETILEDYKKSRQS